MDALNPFGHITFSPQLSRSRSSSRSWMGTLGIERGAWVNPRLGKSLLLILGDVWGSGIITFSPALLRFCNSLILSRSPSSWLVEDVAMQGIWDCLACMLSMVKPYELPMGVTDGISTLVTLLGFLLGAALGRALVAGEKPSRDSLRANVPCIVLDFVPRHSCLSLTSLVCA